MERDKSFDVIAILAIVLSVVGITLGYAAFTSNLEINDSSATISAADEQTAFQNKLYWSGGAGTDILSGEGTATITFAAKEFDKSTGSVTYTANVSNQSAYTAYMKSVAASTGLTCSSSDISADPTVIDDFCSLLTATVTFDGTNVTGSIIKDSTTLGNNLNGLATPLSIEPSTGVKTVVITLSVPDNTTYPDKSVIVTMPAITFNYSTAQ